MRLWGRDYAEWLSPGWALFPLMKPSEMVGARKNQALESQIRPGWTMPMANGECIDSPEYHRKADHELLLDPYIWDAL